MTDHQQDKKWRSVFRNDLFVGKVALVTGGEHVATREV